MAVLGARTNKQRQEIAAKYQQKYVKVTVLPLVILYTDHQNAWSINTYPASQTLFNPRSNADILFRAPNGFNELTEVRFKLSFILIGKSWEPEQKSEDCGAVSQTDLTRD